MDDALDVFRRLRRNANSTSSASSEEDLFTESNNLAMFVVIPVMVFVYGGCACIYCCYKCRRYLRENRPFQDIADKIRGRETNNNESEVIDDVTQDDQPDQESRTELISAIEQNEQPEESHGETGKQNSHSTHSSPGPEGPIRYVDYDTDLRSAMSSPGVQYKRNGSVKSKRMKLGTPISVVYNENDSEMRSDSGIMDDAGLMQSDSMLSKHRLPAEVPLSIEELDNSVVETTGGNSYSGNAQGATSPVPARYISTSEIAIQTDDISFARSLSSTARKIVTNNAVVAKYMDWRKNPKEGRNNRVRETTGEFSKSDTKHSFSSDSGISVISGNKLRDPVSRKESTSGLHSKSRRAHASLMPERSTVNTRGLNRNGNKPIQKNQTTLPKIELKNFIVGPWK